MSDSYSLAPSSIAPTTTPADLFANTPAVTDTAGSAREHRFHSGAGGRDSARERRSGSA